MENRAGTGDREGQATAKGGQGVCSVAIQKKNSQA